MSSLRVRSRVSRSMTAVMMGSSPDVGSSLKRSSGSSATARARPTRLRMPPLISAGLRFSNPVSPTSSSFILTMRSTISGSTLLFSMSGSATFSPTVSDWRRAPNWKFIPNRRRSFSRSVCGIVVISSPKSLIDPEVGFIAPMMWRKRVLFPHPDPPMMITVSPLFTEKLTPLSTVRGPNFRTRSRISMTGADIL